jgi:uncharacterized protein (DUF1697 family)/3-methyladenine DNA glycosylase AlkD
MAKRASSSLPTPTRTVVIALLRGINVAGQKRVPMLELREIAATLGFEHVQSYIQSGNLVFATDLAPEAAEASLEKAIAKRFGFSVDVIARSDSAWREFAQGSPFPEAERERPHLVLLGLSKKPVTAGAAQALARYATAGERVDVHGDVMWLDYNETVGRSKLTPAVLDRTLGSRVTARNIRTVRTLATLAAAVRATVTATTGSAPTTTRTAPRPAKTKPTGDSPIGAQLDDALAWLEKHGSKKTRDGMVGYGIHAKKAFGATMADIRVLSKQLGRNHALAAALWETGVYEARLLTAFVDEPELLMAAQMDRFCRDFDNWAVCDTLCFALFDRTPHALGKVVAWSKRGEEFVKRAAFALLACVALHRKDESDDAFLRCLPLIERAATDDRNFVKKAVNWALRAVGGRSKSLHDECVALAARLATSSDTTARWIGKDALKGLKSPATLKRLGAKKKTKA